MDTNKKQTRNIIITSIFITVLVLIGVFYFKNNENIDIEDDTKDNIDVEIPVIADDNIEFVNIEDEKSLVNTGDNTNINDEKFNTALSNGSVASNAGDYTKALGYFNEALKYKDSDVVYVRLFSVYSAQKDWNKALEMIDKAILLNPAYTDYWNFKLTAMDKGTSSFEDMKKVYDEGILKVNWVTRVNLVTRFAGIAENNSKKAESINLWEYAKNLYPDNSSIYQAEIDRLEGS